MQIRDGYVIDTSDNEWWAIQVWHAGTMTMKLIDREEYPNIRDALLWIEVNFKHSETGR